MNTAAEKKLKSLFANHPTTDTFFVTSDDMAFFELAAANVHANNTLKDDVVNTVTREEVDAFQETPVEDGVKKPEAPVVESPVEDGVKKPEAPVVETPVVEEVKTVEAPVVDKKK